MCHFLGFGHGFQQVARMADCDSLLLLALLNTPRPPLDSLPYIRRRKGSLKSCCRLSKKPLKAAPWFSGQLRFGKIRGPRYESHKIVLRSQRYVVTTTLKVMKPGRLQRGRAYAIAAHVSSRAHACCLPSPYDFGVPPAQSYGDMHTLLLVMRGEDSIRVCLACTSINRLARAERLIECDNLATYLSLLPN